MRAMKNFLLFLTFILIINDSLSIIRTHIYHDPHTCQKQLTKFTPTSESDKPKSCYRYNNPNRKKSKNDECFQSTRIISNECYVHSIFTKSTDLNEAFRNLVHSDVDSNSTIQTIKITIFEELGDGTTKAELMNHTLVGEMLDDFLIPRPWWRVVYEPYSWSSSNT